MFNSEYRYIHTRGWCSINFDWPYYSHKDLEYEKFNAELLLFAEVNKLIRDGRKYYVESQGWRSQPVRDELKMIWSLEYRIILAEPNKADVGEIVYLPIVGEEYRLSDRLFKRKAENVWLRVS